MPKTAKQKAKQSSAYINSKKTYSTPNSIKTSKFWSLSKTARQANSRVKSIYGTGNSQGLQKIADSQKKYAAAVEAQKNLVKTKQEEAKQKLDNLQAQTLRASPLGSRKKSKITEYFSQRKIKKKRAKASSNLSKQESILKTLEGKKTSYNTKAAEQIAKISKSKIGSQIGNMSTQKSLATAMNAAKKQYTNTVSAPLKQKQAQFEVAKAKKSQINTGVITTKKALTEAETKLAYAKASPYASTPEGKKIINDAQTKLEKAQTAFTGAEKQLKTPEYTISAQQVQTIGKELRKTKKIDLIDVDKLSGVAKGNQKAINTAKQSVTDIKSSIQINRKTAKYSALDKLKKYTKPELQTEMIKKIKQGASSNATPKEKKKAIKYQAILGILNKQGLLSTEQKQTFEKITKVQTVALQELTPEQKRIAGLKLTSNIATAKADAAAAAAAAKAADATAKAADAAKVPGAFTKFFSSNKEKTNAQTKAQTKANNAKTASNTAKTAATEAKTAANTAKTKAQAAFNASNAGKIDQRQKNEATLAAAQKTLATEKAKKVRVYSIKSRKKQLKKAIAAQNTVITEAKTKLQTAQTAADTSLAAEPKKTVAELTKPAAVTAEPVTSI